MSARLLEGKPIAKKIQSGLKSELEKLTAARGRPPKLVAIQVGDNQASAIYLKSQMRLAQELGIAYELKNLPAGASQDQAEALIKDLNAASGVDGMILQLPAPNQIDARRLVKLVAPAKDAEGMHPENLGRLVLGKWKVSPCTASACLALIESTGVDLYGKEVVVVGHSEIVGKPLALMLLRAFATTTVCHIGTSDKGHLVEHARRAEILIVAVGKAGLIKGDWIREGAIVIDVGINKAEERVVGDVEFEEAAKRASYITPVPGGVGPLTVTMLMKNVVELSKSSGERL